MKGVCLARYHLLVGDLWVIQYQGLRAHRAVLSKMQSTMAKSNILVHLREEELLLAWTAGQ